MVNMVAMKLRAYLDESQKTAAEFATEIGVTVQAVHRYINDERFPAREVRSRIQAATNGKVQLNDFGAMQEARAPTPAEAAA